MTNPIMNKNLKNVYCVFVLFNLSANVKKSIIPEKSKKSQIPNKYLKPIDWQWILILLNDCFTEKWTSTRRHFSRWLFLRIYPIIYDLQGFKHVSFDPSKQVKVALFSRKQNSYPHTPLSFSSKYVTLYIRNT